MTFTVSQKDEINVYHGSRLFLKAYVKNSIKYNLRFFKDDKFILETSSFAFMLFKKVWIIEQCLPYNIDVARQKGVFGFIVTFDNHSIYTKHRPLRTPAYNFFLNNHLIGEVEDYKGITIGRHYTVNTFTDDETLNLYLLIAFIIQFIAL